MLQTGTGRHSHAAWGPPSHCAPSLGGTSVPGPLAAGAGLQVFFPAAGFWRRLKVNLDPTVVLQDAVFVCRQVDHKEERVAVVQLGCAPGFPAAWNGPIHRDPSQGSSPGSACELNMVLPRKADRERGPLLK